MLNLQTKSVVLQAYADELMEQNELLLHTVIELQKEACNRANEMEKRLNVSAKATEEVVLSMNNYEQDLKAIISDRITTIEAADLIEELNCQLDALKLENHFLRDHNDNLKHDLNNLIKIIKNKVGSNYQESNECLTFCHIQPEDVYGPIETINSSNNERPSPECLADESIQVEMENKDSLKSSSSQKFLAEEKEVLVHKLQEHLQTAANELELKNEVIKNLETKLYSKRQETDELAAQLHRIALNCTKYEEDLKECKERIETLNDQKRSLMIQLDEESEAHCKCKEDLKYLIERHSDCETTIENQALTIGHLREAMVLKSKSETTHLNGISATTSPSQNL